MSEITKDSTAEDVIKFYNTDLTGKVIIVTGPNSGIGLETARALAITGAKIIIPCRSTEKANSAIEHIKQTVPNADLVPMILDLSDFQSVRSFAKEFLLLNLPLHILINNAGLVTAEKSYTKDGFEMNLGVNHLGHFLLVELLREKIKQSAPSRIVIVSSNGQGQFLSKEGIDFNNLNCENHFNPMAAYAQSKLMNVYHAKELQRQFDAEGVDVTVTTLHPGFIITNIGNDKMSFKAFFHFFTNVRWSRLSWDPIRPVGVGASTSVYCAVAPNLVKGEYYSKNAPYPSGLNEQGNNTEAMKKLWEISEKYIADGHP